MFAIATAMKPKKAKTTKGQTSALPSPQDDPNVLAARGKKSELLEQRGEIVDEIARLAAEIEDTQADDPGEVAARGRIAELRRERSKMESRLASLGDARLQMLRGRGSTPAVEELIKTEDADRARIKAIDSEVREQKRRLGTREKRHRANAAEKNGPLVEAILAGTTSDLDARIEGTERLVKLRSMLAAFDRAIAITDERVRGAIQTAISKAAEASFEVYKVGPAVEFSERIAELLAMDSELHREWDTAGRGGHRLAIDYRGTAFLRSVLETAKKMGIGTGDSDHKSFLAERRKDWGV